MNLTSNIFLSIPLLFYIEATAAGAYIDSGFHVGLHAGYVDSRGDYRAIFDDGFGLQTPELVFSKNQQSTGLMGAFGGYRYVFNNGYTISTDIIVNYYGRNELQVKLLHDGIDFFTNRLKRHIGVIPRASFGKIIGGKFHASFGLGLGISRFKHQVDNISGEASVKSSQTRFAFIPSLQIEYACAKEFSLVGCVSYEIYQKIQKKFGQEVAPELPSSSYFSSIKPRYLTLTAGFAFKL